MFGRTVGQARASLVRWTVPFASGLTISVHYRALPAFQQAAANLAASGGFYSTRWGETFGFTARTVAGSQSVSYHAFGAAIDINSRTNPTSDGLITDMPPWYIDAWRRAGFCWGGDWIGGKDPMHYSWMGPAATPGYGSVPPPYPSLAAAAPFNEAPVIQHSALGGRRTGAIDGLADFTGDGSLDSVRLKIHTNAGPIVEIMGSWADHGMCGFTRYQLPGADLSRRVIFGNTAFGSRPDIVFLDFSGSTLSLKVYDARSFYQEVRSISTGASSDPAGIYLLADYDSDGKADLFSLTGGNLQIWDGASGYVTSDFGGTFTVGTDTQVLTGDRDLDGRADLYSIDGAGAVQIFTAAGSYAQAAETAQLPFPIGTADVLRISDYDGDGHGDLHRLDANGFLVVALGNHQIYADIDGWFRRRTSPARLARLRLQRPVRRRRRQSLLAGYRMGRYGGRHPRLQPAFQRLVLSHAGREPKPDGELSRQSVVIARPGRRRLHGRHGIHPRGRHQPDRGGRDNPWLRSRVCSVPSRRSHESRWQASWYGPMDSRVGAPNPFSDVTSAHAGDVAALFAAGVTTGCSTNPPAYCPAQAVLREQMAAFLHRVTPGG